MKILLLTQFFSDTRGGGEYVFSLLAKKLAEHENEVWVITNKIVKEQYITEKNIHIIFVEPTLRYAGGMPAGFSENIRYAINAIRAGRKLAKENDIDIIHSNNFAPALAGSLLSSITSIPHITTIHDVFSACGKNHWKQWGAQAGISKIGIMVAPLFEKLSVKLHMKCIHTVSEASRDDLVKIGAKKPIHVIHNSISGNTIHGNITQNQQFVSVGRLVFYKNLEIVIDAIGIIKKKHPKVRLIIVGDGPHREKLVEHVSKLGLESSVVFAGYVSAKEKTKIISESAAMVFPSTCEGFGLVILEAFLQKKPVLVSDMKPTSEIVDDEKTGYIIEPQDATLWAEKMSACIENPQKISEMGNNGYDTLESRYNQDIMYEKIIKMYKQYK